MKCAVCGEKTDYFSDASPDDDWREQVEAAKTIAEPEVVDKVILMRRSRLERAGFGPLSVLELASRRDIDLHRAEELAGKAGPELAARILI